MEKLYIFIIVLTAIIVATIVSLTLRHLNQMRKHTMSMPATVVSTRTMKRRKKGLDVAYFATFELHNKELRELLLPKYFIDQIEIGKRGMITFTPKHLQHFKEGEHPDHLLRVLRK